MPQLVDYVQCLHAIGQTTFESSSMKTIGKHSQNPYVLGKLEIPARTCPGKRGLMVTLTNYITCVGVIWVMSSDASCFSKVVLPPLSNPRSNIRTSWSGVLLSLRKIDNKPWKPSKKRRLYNAPSLCKCVAWRHKHEHQQTNRFQEEQ